MNLSFQGKGGNMKRKKHNPAKRAQAFNKALFKNKAVMYFVDGTFSNECQVWDLKNQKPFKPNKYMADQLQLYPQKWSCYLAVMGRDNQGKNYTKAIQVDCPVRYKHAALVEYMNERHQELLSEFNPQHKVTAGWLASPIPHEFDEKECLEALELAGAFEFMAKWEQAA